MRIRSYWFVEGMSLSEDEKKVLILHGLYSHLNYAACFKILKIDGYSARQRAADRLQEMQLLDFENKPTTLGWKTLLQALDAESLRDAVGSLQKTIGETESKLASTQSKWAPLRAYIQEPYREAEPRHITINAPADVAAKCNSYLGYARLCVLVGAWAGAISYCSLAVEYLLWSVLVTRDPRMALKEPPALQVLNGEFGKNIPEVHDLTQRLVALIANFRNDSVHPRDQRLSPGENQARAVFDLTARLMNEVNARWFSPPVVN